MYQRQIDSFKKFQDNDMFILSSINFPSNEKYLFYLYTRRILSEQEFISRSDKKIFNYDTSSTQLLCYLLFRHFFIYNHL